MKRILFALCCCASIAQAFPINPYVAGQAVEYEKTKKYRSILEHVISPVHENLSRLAYQCASQLKDGGQMCDMQAGAEIPGIDIKVLVNGTRWNDDPNNFFHDRSTSGAIRWLNWMNDAAVRKAAIDETFALQYRSHYGDLQFLHAMSLSRKKDAVLALADVLNWAHFAYEVATGRIGPNVKLGELGKNQPFGRNFGGTAKANWVVKKLFTNYYDFKSNRNVPATDEEVATLALGALLHTIQDSYSASHVDREGDTGPIKAWLDYAQQDPTCHKKIDFKTVFIGTPAGYQHPAVLHGSWLIASVAAKKPWEGEVETRLRDNVFAPAANQRAPDAGSCGEAPNASSA